MSSSGSSFCLAKITFRLSGLRKIKLLKYKMLIVQRNKRFFVVAVYAVYAVDVVAVCVR